MQTNSISAQSGSHPRAFASGSEQPGHRHLTRLHKHEKCTPVYVDILGEKNRQDFDFLLPEQLGNVRPLFQSEIDHAAYRTIFYEQLTRDQRTAVREWTATNKEYPPPAPQFYDDRQPVLTYGHNFSLNNKLAMGLPMLDAEVKAVNDLVSALKKLPAVSGEFLRAIRHQNILSFDVPWGTRIQINDVVSDASCVMSASSKLERSRRHLSKDAVLNPAETHTNIVFKIVASEAVSTAVPLINGISAAPDYPIESVVLFHPESCFRVDGIATVSVVRSSDEPSSSASSGSGNAGAVEQPRCRIGVILTQIHPQAANVKSMVTGRDILPSQGN